MQAFLIMALVIAVLALIFALQNTLAVTVHFLVWEYEGPLALVLLLTLVLGALTCFLALLPTLHRRRKLIVQKERRIQELEHAFRERPPQAPEASPPADRAS
jgi:uncharacterized integral membrane protein